MNKKERENEKILKLNDLAKTENDILEMIAKISYFNTLEDKNELLDYLECVNALLNVEIIHRKFLKRVIKEND